MDMEKWRNDSNVPCFYVNVIANHMFLGGGLDLLCHVLNSIGPL